MVRILSFDTPSEGIPYFGVASSGLALAGKADTKRFWFFSGWLIIALACALACALASHGDRAARRKLTACLVAILALGWAGTLSRRWYSAPHFIEPWAEVAARAAESLRPGSAAPADVIVSNSPSFFFHLDYALANAGMLPGRFVPRWTPDPRVFWVQRGRKSLPPPTHGRVLWVRGVNQSLRPQTEQTEQTLRARCALLETSQLIPDSGSRLKQLFFPGLAEPPYRIVIRRYSCP